MAGMRISDLTTASAVADSDLLEVAKVDGNSSSGYMSYKETMSAISIYITKLATYSNDLNTTDKHIIGAINELKQLVSLIPQFSIEVVAQLPTQDISETTIYLVPNSDPEQGNYYEEYIYVNNAWELVGSTAVDLSAYYTSAEVDTLIAAKANTADVTTALATKENKSDMPTDVRTIIKDCKTPKNATITNGIAQFECIEENLVKWLKVTMNPIQDLSHGDPSPTNICPISGRTETSVTKMGKNLIVGKLAGMAISSQGRITSSSYDIYIIKTKAGQKYICSKNGESFGTYWAEFENYPSGGDYSINGARQSENIATATIDGYIAMRFPQDATKPQIELGETITAYEPPITPETHTHQYGQTVYGGEDDFVNGGLTNEWGYIASYNGETLPSEWVSDRDVYQAGTTPTTGAEVVYRLSTPTTIQTSAEEITTVAGTNIISGTEPISECKYTEIATVDDLRKIIGGQ